MIMPPHYCQYLGLISAYLDRKNRGNLVATVWAQRMEI